MSPSDARKALLDKFRQVCAERVDTVAEGFSALVDNPGQPQRADGMMRELHTLKGELRLMGFPGAGKLVHALEDALNQLRQQGFAGAADFRNLVLDVLDLTLSMVKKDRDAEQPELCQQLNDWLAARSGQQGRPGEDAAARQIVAAGMANSREIYSSTDTVRVSGSQLDELADLAGDFYTSYLRLAEVGERLEQLQQQTATLVQELKAWANDHPLQDQLQNLTAGPLADSERLLAHTRRGFLERSGALATVLDLIIDKVRQIRLLPIATLFDRYRKAARDLAREQDRRLEVHVEGGTILVDRSVLDALNEVLLHLVRNTVDHGLEDEATRRRAGKPAAGNLWLRARLAGDRLFVEVADDGRGIDFAKVKQVALERGLLSPAEIESQTPESILELIFSPGFSTRRQVSQLSGRGVGMDVVKNRIQDLGGAIRVDSQPGAGTRFTLEMPTSVAISRVLTFRVARLTFAVMATFVDRLLRIDADELIDSGAGPALAIEEQLVPLVPAASLLGLDGGSPDQGRPRHSVVVLSHGNRLLGLLVDELLGERELTIKPLGGLLEAVPGLAGAAMQEDGSAVVLLHAGTLVAGSGKARLRPARIEEKAAERRRRVLLVEDSLITRELERSLLVSLGMEVVEAGDGSEAWQKLEQQEFDLVISDIEMPHLDGLELTRRIKDDPRWARLPVILVTTLGSEQDRKAGMEAGADAYVVKSDFDSRDFIRTVERFLPGG